jgi:hypothetical protein
MTTTEANSSVTETADAARDAGDEIADEARSRVGLIRVTVEGAVEHVPAVLEKARTGAERVAERLPDAAARARLGVEETTITLQALPDPTLRLLAAASLGLATGLCLAGASRLLVLAASAPALLAGGAMATRPGSTLGGVRGRPARLAGKETDR